MSILVVNEDVLKKEEVILDKGSVHKEFLGKEISFAGKDSLSVLPSSMMVI